MGHGSEYQRVELPLINQLKLLGWTHFEGSPSDPSVTGRSSFRDTILEDRLRAKLREINLDPRGQPWLDAARLSQAIGALTHPKANRLLEINRDLTNLLLLGTQVDGLGGWDQGRNQTVQYIDWTRPERNEFLVINQFRVDELGGLGRNYVVPDAVLFVNGIPLVVVECKAPEIVTPMAKAIDQLRRYANQRGSDQPEGNEELFHTNQFVIATYFEQARAGTFTSSPEHFAEWKTTEPVPEDEVAAALGVSALSSQQRLVAGMLTPERLLDLVRHYTLFMEVGGGRTIKAIARYQQYRAVQRAVHRLTTGATRRQDGEHDRRGGIIWHTQGSGKSLTMVFLVRVLRTHPELVRMKVVVVTDRTQLQDQLSGAAALTGETVQTATRIQPAKTGKKSNSVTELLGTPGKALVFVMIQKYRNPEARRQDEAGMKTLGVLDASEDVVVLVDEAHRSQASDLHSRLMEALPNCARIGFTGTPIIMGRKTYTHTIFGEYLDRYTILESQEDEATLPILYEGRTTKSAIRDAADLDELFEDMFIERTPEELEAIKQRYATKGNVLEADRMIRRKAKDMLRHYIDGVLPNGFKAQLVATSRRAVVRYRDALLEARDELLRELDGLDPEYRTAEARERADGMRSQRFARLVRAWPHRDLIAKLDFVPVISEGDTNDPKDWADWTTKSKQDTAIADFKKPLPLDDDADPEQTSPVAFLIVNFMLLTGFDAPVEQVLYLDRGLREAELLQAIARVNRTAAGKKAGYVVDYFGVADNLKVALAAYLADDIEGALTSIRDELPRLDDRHKRLCGLFRQRGIQSFSTQADQDACVDALADERLRAAFEAALKLFVDSLEIIRPRPEALPYSADAKAFGTIAKIARQRYRDSLGFDVSLYGEKVKRLIDDHVEALNIDLKIPPVSITAADFDAKVAGLRTDRAKASEMEHAIRYHLREHYDQDPEHYQRLSERLEEILTSLRDQWDQLAQALRDFLPEVRAGRQDDDSGLDARTEAPFYALLKQELAGPSGQMSEQADAVLRQVVLGVVPEIKRRIALVGFWQSSHQQLSLRSTVAERLTEPIVDGEDLFDFKRAEFLADRVVELAKANHARLLTR